MLPIYVKFIYKPNIFGPQLHELLIAQGGQFAPAKGGQFGPARPGQFKSAKDGQLHRLFQPVQRLLELNATRGLITDETSDLDVIIEELVMHLVFDRLKLTQEQQVAKDYSAAMDSVNLLNAGKPEKMDDVEWSDTVKRNKEHLEIQIAKGNYYAGYDLTPFENAIK